MGGVGRVIIESRREMSGGPVKGARAIVARAFVADYSLPRVYAGPAARRRRRRSSVREDRGIRRGCTPWTRPGVRGAAEKRDACSSRETPVFARFSNKVRHNAPSIRRLRPVWRRQTETSRYGRSFRAAAYSGPVWRILRWLHAIAARCPSVRRLVTHPTPITTNTATACTWL